MPRHNDKPKRSFCVSASFLSGSAALLTAVVAVAGLFLPESQSSLGDRAPTPVMIGDVVDIQLAVRHPCCTFSVQVRLSGFRGQECFVRATLINVVDGSETRGDEIFTSEADAYQARVNVSVSAATPATYIARFILYASDGVELDRSETMPFSMVPYDHDTRPVRPGEFLLGRNPMSREHLPSDQPRQRIRTAAVHRRFLAHERRRHPQLPDLARTSGLHQARRALACAAAGECDRGTAEGRKALALARATKSSLVTRELKRLGQTLRAATA
jgi:hypothetical protein